MDKHLIQKLARTYQPMKDHLFNGIIPFWRQRAPDREYGGYVTNYDESGKALDTSKKDGYSQARLVWFFSHVCRMACDPGGCGDLARAGVEFMIERFWDKEYGGWYCRLQRNGDVVLDNKIVYDQCFAIYALSEYFLAFGDNRCLKYAEDTFDLLQKYCADTLQGGYYECFQRDWRISPAGDECGDFKSLDSHMHLMEAYTTLYQATGKEIHRRKLLELMDLIVRHMVDPASGCGRNQFDPSFNPTPGFRMPDVLYGHDHDRVHPDQSLHYTSYGHNVELSWLMRHAHQVAQEDIGKYREVLRGLLDHSVRFGVDWEYGGLYRVGLYTGEVLIKEKEFWQQTETLIGFLDGYEEFKEPKYIEAYLNIWKFSDSYLINHSVGEWRHFTDRGGKTVDGTIGKPCKNAYHTGRSMIECTLRLERLLKLADAPEEG
jgi:mannobiose 2-epimerase